MKDNGTIPALPPARRRIRPTRTAGRRNDLVRREVFAALRASNRYAVIANLRVPVTEEARKAVKRADGRYLGVSLPVEGAREDVVLDMVVIDERNGWAGGYAFCRPGAQSPLARRQVEEDLRAAELVLRAHLTRLLKTDIRTAVVGIIDDEADSEHGDDLTIPASEIAAHFEVPFGALDEGRIAPQGSAA